MVTFRTVRSSRLLVPSGRSKESPFTWAFKSRKATNGPVARETRFSEGSLANWDVFHADRLELERGLEPTAIRRAFERGELGDDDLVRPAGTTVAWSRLADMPELTEAAASAAVPANSAPASTPPTAVGQAAPEPPARRKAG